MARPKTTRGHRNHKSPRNPGMKMKRSRSMHNTGRHHHRKRRWRNPGVRHHHRRWRNPGFGSDIGPMITNAVFVIVGALGSKLGAQAVLGTNNVGLVGYAANAGTGVVLWFLADKVMKNRAAAAGIVAGTLVQIILRVINDYTPFGQYVSNLGMGDYQMQSFVTPQVLVDPWRNADIQVPPGWGPARALPAASMPSASAGPSQMQGGRGGRAASAAPAAAAAPASPGVSGFGGSLYGGGMTSLYG